MNAQRPDPPGKGDIRRFLRPHLAQMPSYEPVVPIDVVAAEIGLAPEQIVKLDANENPYGPSPMVAQALARFPHYHIYPDPLQQRAREAVARYVGVRPSQVVLGSGSDELLNIAATLFVGPGDTVITCPPTFGMYAFLGELHGGAVVSVPRTDDFQIDMPALERVVRESGGLLFLASPNNPTGNPLPRDQLEQILEHEVVVVVDEAYAEFTGESVVDLVSSRDNLIVVRTFSKWAGLAGLRAGYGVFPEAIAEMLWRVKVPYNLSVAAEQAVLASLEDVDYLMANVKKIVTERERLRGRLDSLGWLRTYPSAGNFILCEVSRLPAELVRQRLREKGILVRYFDSPGLRNYLRISVGKPEHTDRLLDALQEIGAAVAK